jgi:hypothetical protein
MNKEIIKESQEDINKRHLKELYLLLNDEKISEEQKEGILESIKFLDSGGKLPTFEELVQVSIDNRNKALTFLATGKHWES